MNKHQLFMAAAFTGTLNLAAADLESEQYKSVRLPSETIENLHIHKDGANGTELRGQRPSWMNKISQPLRKAWHTAAFEPRKSPAAPSVPEHFVDNDRILVEIRYDAALRDALYTDLNTLDIKINQDITAGNWMEAWLPITLLPDIVKLQAVHSVGVARPVEPTGTGTTTEGFSLGNVADWHAGDLDGSGFTIAVIDLFGDNDGQVAELQNSGDWPPDDQLQTEVMHDYCNGVFGGCPFTHGNNVIEVIYDIAPGAEFIAYDAHSVGEWYQAVYQAIDDGADIINASLIAPKDGMGDGSALPGSISEAKQDAHAAGILPINAAGNQGEKHWGGEFNPFQINGPFYDQAHLWTDSQTLDATLNFIGPRGEEDYVDCIPNGTHLSALLMWNDWQQVDDDYDLRLYRLDDEAGDGLLVHAVSDDLQDGSPGQLPIETISATAETSVGYEACENADEAAYAWRIYSRDASGDHNFRFLSEKLRYRTNSSTIMTPADSPSVIAVAAVYAGDWFNSEPGTLQMAGSSEGPILAPGGAAPTGMERPLKPDVSSFTFVETTTSENLCCGFGGTSAAAPHISGMAALLWQRHSLPWLATNDEIAQRIRDISTIGDNDLGDPGFDYQYGWGRLSFQVEDQLVVSTQPSDSYMNIGFDPTVTVEVRDTIGNRVLSGPTRWLNVDFGNDPSGGYASLSPILIWHVLDGVVPFGGLSVDHPGEGYTLNVHNGGLSVETTSFNILEAIFRDRFAED